MYRFKHLVLLALAVGMGAFAVHRLTFAQDTPRGVTMPDGEKPFKQLSDYGFFRDGPGQVPADGVTPYTVNTPLFSDYTTKYRFVWMPEHTSASYTDDGVFHFPVGAVLIKTFAYLHDLRDPGAGQTLIETRLLIHNASGWQGWTYVWNDEQTDAVLKVAGGRKEMSWIHSDGAERHINYIIPNVNQCKGCHIKGAAILPIGPKASNLNGPYPYPEGKTNQLAHWTATGILTGAPSPEEAPNMPVWDDTTVPLGMRARAYLDVNCSHCHSPGGPGNTSGLDLRFTQENPYDWGVMRAPVAAGRGAGDRAYDIVPGHPDASIIPYRMESVDPGVMMPELPRLTVHEEGVALIRSWIASLPAPS